MSVFLGEAWKEKEGSWTQSPLEWELGETLPQDQVRNGCLTAAEKRQRGIEARMRAPRGQGPLFALLTAPS